LSHVFGDLITETVTTVF